MAPQRKHLLLVAAAGLIGLVAWEAAIVRRQDAQLEALQDQASRNLSAVQQAHRVRNDALRQIDAVESAANKIAIPDSGGSARPSGPAPDPVAERWIGKVAELKERIGQMPGRQIPEFALLTETEWLLAAQNLQWETDEQARKAFSTLRAQAKMKLGGEIADALPAYAAANGDRLPTDARQLAPYLNPPVPEDALQRYEMVRVGFYSQVAPDEWLVAEKSPVDDEFDTRQLVSSSRYAQITTNPAIYLTIRAISKFAAATAGGKPATASDLVNYLEAPLEPSRLESVFQSWQAEPAALGLRPSRTTRRAVTIPQ